MKVKPLILDMDRGMYIPCQPCEATHLRLCLPGPIQNRILPVMVGGSRAGTSCWTWNGSVDSPTLRPSVLTRDGTHTCHSWITDGKVQFLSDCSHELAGQTLDLLDIERDDNV